MHLIEQLCPKEEMKIEVDINLRDWLIDTQMSDSMIATPMLPPPQILSQNSTFQGFFSL